MPRLLHTMIRVSDFEASIDFYQNMLGMTLLRVFDQPEDKYSLAFMGFGPEDQTAVLELTYNYGKSNYDLGTGFGHIAIGVSDCHAFCKRLENKGWNINRPPGPLKGSNEIIAFIRDPDGYPIEIIQH